MLFRSCRERMRGEDDSGMGSTQLGYFEEGGPDAVGEECDQGGFAVPRTDGHELGRRAQRAASTVEILLRPHGRRMRGEHERDHAIVPLQAGCRVLDQWGRVLGAESDHVASRGADLESLADPFDLGRRALGQRRYAADGLVAAHELGELSWVGWPAMTDAGEERADLGRVAGVPCAMTRTPTLTPSRRRLRVDEVDHAPRGSPGSVSGRTPWPRLKTWPGAVPAAFRRARCRDAPCLGHHRPRREAQRRVQVSLERATGPDAAAGRRRAGRASRRR